MKKILLLSAMLAIGLTTYAQTANPLKSTPAHAVTDTVVNTGVKFQYTQAAIVPTSDLTVQFVITKISGTVAGSVVLQGSLDKTNWINIGSAVTPTDVAVQTGSFSVPLHAYLWYRLSYTGAGTMSAKLVSNYIARKRYE